MDSTNGQTSLHADLSATAQTELLGELTRTEKNRAYKAAERARKKAAGITVISIELSAEEAKAFRNLQAAQSGPIDSFAKRALLTGAKFVANSGNTRGGKTKIRSTEQAAALSARADRSNKASAHDRGTHREDTADTQNP